MPGCRRTLSRRARASYDIDDFVVRASIGERGLIDLCYYSPSLQAPDDKKAFHAAFVATETLLGERCLDRWIGTIEVIPFPESPLGGPDAPRHTIKLDRLKETVEAAVESIRDQLSPDPHYRWAGNAKWTIWKLKPKPANDFPGQIDLFWK
jgi:hypothetical protein